MTALKTVFMGSGPFGLPSLRRLLARPDVALSVVTQPDRPAGRGSTPTATPVADETPAGIALKKYQNVNDPAAVAEMAAIGMDLLIVCDFGQMLRQPVLDLARIGPYNIHGSFLPAYRGAAPIQRAILDGATTTGVTILRVELKCDAGPIVYAESTTVGESETYGDLHARLAATGARLLDTFLDEIAAGLIPPATPQDDSRATMASKIKKEELRLNFGDPADAVLCRVRAFAPSPGSYAILNDGARMKVLAARPAPAADCPSGSQGEIRVTPDKRLIVSCAAQTAIEITTLQLQGGRAMPAKDMLIGRPDFQKFGPL